MTQTTNNTGFVRPVSYDPNNQKYRIGEERSDAAFVGFGFNAEQSEAKVFIS